VDANAAHRMFAFMEVAFRVVVVEFFHVYTLYMEKDWFVHLFHIILVSGLFFYVGTARTTMPGFMYPVLLGLGVFIAAYHAYKAYFKKHAWVNYIHIFIVAPLLIYIGYNKEETSRKYFELLLMLAFASFGYHAYYLVVE